MSLKLYAEVGNRILLLLNDVEKDAKAAEMTLDEYVLETQRINPQFDRVFISDVDFC